MSSPTPPLEPTAAGGPLLVFPPELPISARRDDIAAAIRDNQVVIVAGATGSGKTTQLPKILLELGRTRIGHTQPRRIAARTIAERIAEELHEEVGQTVGYRVRFTDRVGRDTRITLMTDGILLNEIHRDRDLRRYDAIIIDEAHERSLTVDFLLGYLKQLMPRRPDLKIVITSATIDPESFSRHFGSQHDAGQHEPHRRGADEHGADRDRGGAPIIEVSGRTYPVEIRYRPLVADAPAPAGQSASPESPSEAAPSDSVPNAAGGEPRDLMDGILDALDELGRESDGDVLVFLSGENEIRDADDAIRGRNLPGTEVLPLYGRLSAADQHRVFQSGRTPGIRRRIVLATNVAETSLTVPGIRYVVDAGTARISRYSVRSKIQRLPIEAISQASANQRSGRSGRTSDGIAIRLYSEEDFAGRPEFTEPEILRTNLAAVILQMISLGLGEIADFPFLQPPDSRGIKDGLDLLRELGAVESGHTARRGNERGPESGPRITAVGRQLAQLPIDPRLARMAIESKRHGTTREVMAIVAGLSIQDPRERPLERRAQADQSHARFTDPTSDFLGLLALWNYLEEKRRELSGNQFRRMCRAEYLNYLRVREWQDVYRQLSRMAKPLGLRIGEPRSDPDGVHRSLLAGLLSQLGLRDLAQKDYLGARQTRFVIFPGSALAKKQPAAIMSAELVETSRLFARTNGAIDPAWAEPIAGELAKRTYSEPHWEKKQGAAVAYERVTLYGLPIVVKRRVQFSRIDPVYARELFIRNVLVEGDPVEGDPVELRDQRVWGFDGDNRALRAELAELEERTRRRDILYDDEAIFDFYHRRIPAEVASIRDFEGWWKTARAETPDLLTMTAENLADSTTVDERLFPSSWRQGDQTLALSYRFEPGAEDDGVTVTVPLPLLAGLSGRGFDWQVPGMREELVTALIRSLPKNIRRNVVPAGDWARTLLAAVDGEAEGDGEGVPPIPITEYLAAQILAKTYTPVSPADFDLERVPSHLRVTFAVADERGETVASGKVLSALQASLKPIARESLARVTQKPADAVGRSALERDGITAWDFDTLEPIRDTQHGGNTIRAYPALVDEGTSVAIRLMGTPEDQAAAHRKGVRRLLALAIPSPTGYVQEHLTTQEKLALAQSPYRTTALLFEDCMLACIDAALADRDIRTRGEFQAVRDEVSATIVDALFGSVALVSRILAKTREADRAIRAATSMALISGLGDARSQLDALVYAHPSGAGFVSATGLERLRRIPVYLDGIVHRVGRLAENPARDRVWMSEVQLATERYRTAGGELPLAADSEPRLVRARWMLEEFRLSLFAQHLPTAEPVSLLRITRVLA